MQKLPVLLAIKHALKAVIHFRGAGIRIGLPWILALAVFSTLDLILFGAADFANPDNANVMSFKPTDMIIAALSMVAFSSIAVNWHRYILLDEVTTSERIFRLDRTVWKYVGRTLLILLIAIIPLSILSAVVLSVVPALSAMLAFPFFVAGIYIMRASIALPATALERSGFGISAALQATRGNNLQFAGLLLLDCLIFFVTVVVLSVSLSIAENLGLTAVKICAVLVSIPANLFLSLFSVSLLSSLYGFFVEQRKF
jgi:hypothetical protein